MKKIILAGILLSMLAGCGKDSPGEYNSETTIYCEYTTTYGDDYDCCTVQNANKCPGYFKGHKLQYTDSNMPTLCPANIGPCK